MALGQSHWLMGLLLVGATFGVTISVFWFALLTAERWYYSGWAGMQVVAVSFGYTLVAPAALGADVLIDRFAELARVIGLES